jgi:hypothetical protein
MLAFGSKCSVGDQLHPDGEMNRDTYELIGAAYSEVEEKSRGAATRRPSAKWRLFRPKLYTPISRACYRHQGKAEDGCLTHVAGIAGAVRVVDLERDLAPYRW